MRPRFHPTPGVAFQIGRPRLCVPTGWIWGFLALVSWGLFLAVLISIPG